MGGGKGAVRLDNLVTAPAIPLYSVREVRWFGEFVQVTAVRLDPGRLTINY
jgi:hypothetical protein